MTRTVFVTSGQVSYVQNISVGGHLFQADEPVAAGGADAGPNPYELLLAALGACTGMTVRMYAERKHWPLEDVQLRLVYGRVHAEDCATCANETKQIDDIEVELWLVGDLSEDQQDRLMKIAEKCPMHRTLTPRIPIRARLADNAERTPAPLAPKQGAAKNQTLA